MRRDARIDANQSLFDYPDDVVSVFNGRVITKKDILRIKRERQYEELIARRGNHEPFIRPCFVLTFYNYPDWWLRVETLQNSWPISSHGQNKFSLDVMRLFPCGYLPMMINFERWKCTFAKIYHHPTRKRPSRQGMAIALAKTTPSGKLLGVERMDKI